MVYDKDKLPPGTAGDAQNPNMLALDPGQQVGFLLRKSYQRNMAIWQELCPDPQLTSVQGAALIALYKHGPSSLTAIGREAAMDPATTRGVIERLRDRGMVSLGADPNDRRKVIVQLEEAGQKTIEDMLHVFNEISELTMEALNPGERIALIFLLRKLSLMD